MNNWNNPLGFLRIAGYVEGVTLVTLLFIAVPIKRVLNIPEVVSIVGPFHGLTFVLYLVLTLNVVSGGGWQPREILRTVIASIIPFGTFFNDAMLKRKHKATLL